MDGLPLVGSSSDQNRSLAIKCPACLRDVNLAGQDGVRHTRSKHIGDIFRASVTFGLSCIMIDRSYHLLVPASSINEPLWQHFGCSPVSFDPLCGLRSPRLFVYAAGHHQPPSYALEFVGERNSGQLGWLTIQQQADPRRRLSPTSSNVPQQGSRSHNQHRIL